MPLNCPQRGDNLRLPPNGGGRKPQRGRHRLWAAIAVLVIIVLIVAGYMLLRSAPESTVLKPAVPSSSIEATTQPPAESAPVATESQPPAEPVPFCERDFDATAKRRKDVADLQAAGGLVHLLTRKQAAPPFDCAAFYLDQGLDINAVGTDGLTALHYAIKANKPKMLRFVIGHGADLEKKAGAKQLEPMGYAYYLALNNPKVDRNQVIAILNDALVEQEQQQKKAQ